MEPAKWKHLISQHLGKRYVKRSVDLMWDLLCVDCGLKPALLLDFAMPSTASVLSLLRDLKSAGLLTNPLNVVTVETDVLIVNPGGFGGVTEPPPLSDVLFVDVSANLDSPRLLSESSHLLEQTKGSFWRVVGKLDSVSSVSVDVQLDRHTNPSTLFGLFLGYPVVYYYDVTLESQGNCLPMVPLVNFVLKGTGAKTGADTTQCRNEERVISSFTVTQSHMSMAADRVDAWFEDKKERGLQCQLFDHLELARRVVQLPSVCL